MLSFIDTIVSIKDRETENTCIFKYRYFFVTRCTEAWFDQINLVCKTQLTEDHGGADSHGLYTEVQLSLFPRFCNYSSTAAATRDQPSHTCMMDRVLYKCT